MSEGISYQIKGVVDSWLMLFIFVLIVIWNKYISPSLEVCLAPYKIEGCFFLYEDIKIIPIMQAVKIQFRIKCVYF